MPVKARAPGKLVVLGEYAVLAGADALVMAVDRHCTAEIGPCAERLCRLETWAPTRAVARFEPAAPSGVGLVDHVVRELPARDPGGAWAARIDTRPFFVDDRKLGLGSSAAALCAFASCWAVQTGRTAPSVETLIQCHRAFQGGVGSGLDVAAAVTGGVIQYRIDPGAEAVIGSVRLPNSVGFAGVFTGISAKTLDFVEQFERWRSARPAESGSLLDTLRGVSETGCAAAREGDALAFLGAIERYAEQLERLGQLIGREIVTAPHREVGALARRFGVVYKTSGAGGGDLGLAFCSDDSALADFGKAVRAARFDWVELGIDQDGLVIEEQV